MAKLTDKDQDALPAHMFAVPGKRMLPIPRSGDKVHDAEHAKMAWDMVERTEGLTAEEKAEARKRILARMRELGMDTKGHEVKEGVSVLGGAVEGELPATAAAGPRAFEVTLIKAGDSSNRLRYSPAVLREAARLFEGAAAFCDHPGAMDYGRAGGRSLRDLVGVYEGVRWDEGAGGVRGTLRLYPGSDWLAAMLGQSLADRAAGKQAPNVGVSADMLVVKTPVVEACRLVYWDVKSVAKVNSCDVVFSPAAGGRLERILEGALRKEEGEALLCLKCGQESCQCGSGLSGAAEGAGPGTTPSGQSGSAPHSGGMVGQSQSQSGREAATAGVLDAARTAGSGIPGSGEISRELEAVRGIRLELCRGLLEQRLAVASLPAPAVEWLRGRFKDRIFEAAELDGDVAGVRSMLGGIVAPGVVQGMGPGAGRPVITGGMGPAERVQHAVDRLFGVKLPDNLSDIPRFSGIREAYLRITGDTGFTGRYDWPNSVLAQAFEADEVTTSIMANIVANSMTKKLVADYQAQAKWWLPFVVRTSLRDMKTQDRTRLNDFAAFDSVNENGAYANLAWDDAKETYTPAKKGNLVTVTLETIINDDVRGVARIPSKLASAAAVTINEFVSGLFTANAGLGSTMTDTYTVFHAAQHQSNTGAAVLSSATVRSAMIVLAKMTNSASKRIGVIGKYLLVSPDLMYTAQLIVGSSLEPGTGNNDLNTLQGALVPIVVPNWTDTNNWYLLADPAQVEMLELGFLNGREEPELLVQDSPTAGAVFTNDAMAFKVRWIFGGGWLDYRGGYAAINA